MLVYKCTNVHYYENLGINTWLKLQAVMEAAIRGFDRSQELCEKKYKVIYMKYNNDTIANKISAH